MFPILRGVELATFQKSKQHVLTAVDFDILKLVSEYHFLTVGQVTRLRYSSGSETTCQDRLKKLFTAGVLDRIRLPHIGTGNTQYLFTLTTQGYKELQPLGINHVSRYRPAETHTLKLIHLQHVISLNDFLIAARLLCRVHPDIQLVKTLHDLDMKKSPLRVTLDRQVVSIVPDGFLDFRLSISGRLYASPCWFEQDRNTEWGKTLQCKLQKIIAAINTSAFQDLFGVSNVTVAIATSGTGKRVELMRSFIQDQLQSMGLMHLADVFLLIALPEVLEPLPLFTAPVWQTIQGDFVSLLELQ